MMPPALHGVRIVDLAQAWAGTYASQTLADLGATVLKVEARSRPDSWRGGYEGERGSPAYPVEGRGDQPWNRSYRANSVNRNKYGITLALNTPEGRGMFLDLVRDADIVLENFTPRVLPNLGLSFEELRAVRPSIVLVSMPAYGRTGPYSDFGGIGGTIEPMSGNAWLLGERNAGPDVSGLMYSDPVAGLHGVAAALIGLFRSRKTGIGRHMEVSQQETMVGMLGEFFARGDLASLGRQENRDSAMAPHGIYPCEGDDQWVAIAVRNDDDWAAFVRACNDPELGTPAYATAERRLAAQDDLDAIVGRWTAARSAAEVERLLLAEGVPVGKARLMDEVVQCPQLRDAGFFVEVPQPDGLPAKTMAGFLARLSRSSASIRLGPVEHGQHSREVLAEYLGIDDEEYARLEAAGITGSGPP